jgi:cytochrome c
MRLISSVIVGAVLTNSAIAGQEPLTFEQGMDLAKQKACLGCHQVDSKRVGPAFVDVANRYGGDREQAIVLLTASIKKGGRGKWGAIPMPAQPQVTEEQANQLTVWILGLQQKPDAQ